MYPEKANAESLFKTSAHIRVEFTLKISNGLYAAKKELAEDDKSELEGDVEAIVASKPSHILARLESIDTLCWCVYEQSVP
jgi:hypothetical protein